MERLGAGGGPLALRAQIADRKDSANTGRTAAEVGTGGAAVLPPGARAHALTVLSPSLFSPETTRPRRQEGTSPRQSLGEKMGLRGQSCHSALERAPWRQEAGGGWLWVNGDFLWGGSVAELGATRAARPQDGRAAGHPADAGEAHGGTEVSV